MRGQQGLNPRNIDLFNERESAGSVLGGPAVQGRPHRVAEQQAGGRAEEVEDGEWVETEARLREEANAGLVIFEETEGGFEEVGERIAGTGRVQPMTELLRRVTLVAQSVARMSADQNLTSEYVRLNDSVLLDQAELGQLCTALSTAAARARAAAADAGRAAAAAVVGALEDKFAGFIDRIGEKLKGVVEQAIEEASKGGKLEAIMASECLAALAKVFDNSLYTLWEDLRTADDKNQLTFTALQKALAGLAAKLKGPTGPIRVEMPPAARGESTPRISRTQLEADSPDIPISAAKEKEKEKEREERRVAEARKLNAVQREQAIAAEKRPADRAVGNTRVEAERGPVVSSGRVGWRRRRGCGRSRQRRQRGQRERRWNNARGRKRRRGCGRSRQRRQSRQRVRRWNNAGRRKMRRGYRRSRQRRAERAAVEQRKKAEEEKRVRDEQAKVAERVERAAVEQRKKAEEEKRVREEQAKAAERAERAAVEQRKKAEEEKRVREEQAKAAQRAERVTMEQRKKAEEEKRAERERMKAQLEHLARLEESANEEERQQKELESEQEKMEMERQRIAAKDVEGAEGQGPDVEGTAGQGDAAALERPRTELTGTNFDADRGSFGAVASEDMGGGNVSGNPNVQSILGEAMGEVAQPRKVALPDELGKQWGESKHFRSSGLTTREKKDKDGVVVSRRYNSEQTVGGVKRNMGSYKEKKLREFTVAVCWMAYYPNTDMVHYSLDPEDVGSWVVHLEFARGLPT
ncbi:unnamed protein product [Closterium sp. NIES-53]